MFNTNANGYSLADVAAATGNGWGNGNNEWWILILFLFFFMGGNGFNGRQTVTTDDMQNQFNFASLERQNNEITANSRQVAYDLSNDIAQLGLALNSAIRDAWSGLNENTGGLHHEFQEENAPSGHGNDHADDLHPAARRVCCRRSQHGHGERDQHAGSR